MLVNVIHCDSCKKLLKEESGTNLHGFLLLPGISELNHPPDKIEINLDDLCDTCAVELNEIISEFLARKEHEQAKL